MAKRDTNVYLAFLLLAMILNGIFLIFGIWNTPYPDEINIVGGFASIVLGIILYNEFKEY